MEVILKKRDLFFDTYYQERSLAQEALPLHEDDDLGLRVLLTDAPHPAYHSTDLAAVLPIPLARGLLAIWSDRYVTWDSMEAFFEDRKKYFFKICFLLFCCCVSSIFQRFICRLLLVYALCGVNHR